MRTIKLALLLLMSSGVLMSAASHAAATDEKNCTAVHMAAPGWTDIEATNAMAGVVLRALGYQQTVQNLSVPITYEGLRKGQIDVFLGNWMPAQAPLVKPFMDAHAFDVVHANLTGAKFTLAVPDYVAAAGVHTFADLTRYAARFGGKIYGIEPGAPANQNIKKMIADKAFGLGDWHVVESSETGMLTQVSRAVREKQWIVFLAWEPHLMNTEFHLTYLSGGDAYFGPDYGGATVNTVVRSGFTAQCKNLGRLFRQMTFSVDIENRMIASVLHDKVNADAAARKMLSANPAMLEKWLDGVTTISGASGLQAVRASIGAQ